MSVRMLCRPPASGLSSHPSSSSSSSSSTSSSSSSTAIGGPVVTAPVFVSSPSTSVSAPSSSSSPPSSPPPSGSFPVPASPPPLAPSSSFSGPSAVSGSVSGSGPNPNPINLSSSLNHAPSNSVPPPAPAPTLVAGSNGIVVVGAISRSEDDVSVLLDRLLDAQVFTAKRGLEHGLGRKEQQPRPGGGGSSNLGNGNSKDTVKPDFGGASNPNLQPYQNGSSHSNEDEAVSQGESQGQEDEIGLRHGKIRSRRGKEGSGSGQSTLPSSVRYLQKNPGKEGRIKEIEKGRREWIDHKLKHYYDEEHGVMYLQFVWGSQPLDFLNEDLEAARGEGIAAALERHEAESLRGLLFMFSVCHIVLMVQEGSRFDPRFLRMFRTLQAAKHALAPFVKTQVLPGLLPAPANKPTLPLRPVSSMTSNTSGRNSGGTGRQSSTIALMSGSAPVLFPGQCTPVTLFVFLEDSPDTTATIGGSITAARADDATESTGLPSGSQTASVHILRQELLSKPSNSTSGPARPGSKPEPGFRKKMQSSTEAQIRFLLKKCRTIASVAGEGGSLGAPVGTGMGPRGLREVVGSLQGPGAGGALFALDPSRAVVFLERSANQRGEALDAVTVMLEEVLEGSKGSADTFTDLVGTSVGGEELLAIKDFLWRHTEILRGRGGISSGSAGNSAGVGMVAAAAAAAAASAASGASGGGNGTKKPLHNPPELPTVSGWFTACQILVDGLSAAWEGTAEDERVDMDMKPEKGVLIRGPEGSPRIVLRKGPVSSPEKNKRNSTGGTLTSAPMGRNRGTTLEEAMANLVSCTDMDLKFSMAWCKRVLPSAHEVYLKGLPPCYPTLTHETHLDRALHSFRAMVRGPAVSLFAEKLQADCEAVWHAGRQLCDAESLTGKPCILHVHEVVNFGVGPEFGRKSAKVGLVTKGGIQEKVARGKDRRISKPHSSGVVFLHACACGRSRRLRKDPFDYESANVSFFQFPNCEDLLPSLAMPSGDGGNSLGGSAWSLVHLGNAQYYQPIVGLTQSGFCTKQNFLSPCKFVVVYHKESTPNSLQTKEDAGPGTEDVATDTDLLASKPKVLLPRPQTAALESKAAGYPQQSLYSKVAEKGAITEMRGLSKAPSVVSDRRAISTTFFKASYGGDAAFPPLPQKNERLLAVTPAKSAKQTSGKERKTLPVSQPMQGEYHLPAKPDTLNVTSEKHPESVNIMQNGRENADKESTDSDAVAVGGIGSTKTEEFCAYVGFEHECPHGHRFLLSVDHLQSLGPSYTQLPSNVQHSVRESSDVLPKQTKQGRRAGPSKEHSTASGGQDASAGFYGESLDTSTPVEQKAAEGLTFMSISEGSSDGHTLLGLNLPIYMNCPYCRDSDSKQDGVVFAGCVSQLQRIFLVTPPFPLVLASRAVVEFEAKAGMEFHSGSEVVLPPDSFLSLRLPFVYYMDRQNGVRTPLLCNKENPERTAWLHKCSAIYVISGGGDALVPAG